MATNTDTQEYKSYDEKGKIVKTVTIPGEEGKQIKVEAVSLQLYSGKSTIINNTVVAINGEPWAAWNWDDAGYSNSKTYDTYPYLIDAGKDAVITWVMKTSDKRYAAKIKNVAYTYSYVDVAAPEEPGKGGKYLVEIECTSEDEAKVAVEDINTKGILKEDMTMYIAKSV